MTPSSGCSFYILSVAAGMDRSYETCFCIGLVVTHCRRFMYRGDGIKKCLELPPKARGSILYGLCCKRLVEVEFNCRTLCFYFQMY